MILSCPVSVGEVVDKLTILEIKKDKIIDENKQKIIEKEFKYLNNLLIENKIFENSQLEELKSELLKINLTLWQIEDDIRDLERSKTFDNQFIELARSVYITNDLRFKVKNQINELIGSEIKEVKSYKDY